MKTLIDKITNKDRLVKLYRCEKCNGTGLTCNYHHKEGFDFCLKCKKCAKCNHQDYTINRDSQVLDIVEKLCVYRITVNIIQEKDLQCKDTHEIANHRLAHALIKLIELAYTQNELESFIDLSPVECNSHEIDASIYSIIFSLTNRIKNYVYCEILDFCKHHKIDIWQSVAEILDSE